jgi:hypothetical protein
MADGTETRCDYGGLVVTCDEEAFARIRNHVLAEPSVAEALGNSVDPLSVRFLRVSSPAPAEKVSRDLSWLAMLPTIVASGLSGSALIVGYITIVRWLVRLIAS